VTKGSALDAFLIAFLCVVLAMHQVVAENWWLTSMWGFCAFFWFIRSLARERSERYD
jgi:hypothetical protein